MSQGAFLLTMLLKTYTAVRAISKTNTIEQLFGHEILIYTCLNNKHQGKNHYLISIMLSSSNSLPEINPQVHSPKSFVGP